jgi:hypothetical protein
MSKVEDMIKGKISEEQAGFTAGKSCWDNTLHLQQIITKQKAKNNETRLVFVNLVKA